MLRTVVKVSLLLLIGHTGLAPITLTFALLQGLPVAVLLLVYLTNNVLIVLVMHAAGRFIASRTGLSQARYLKSIESVAQLIINKLGVYGLMGGIGVASLVSPSLYLSALAAGVLGLDLGASIVGIVAGDLPSFLVLLSSLLVALDLAGAMDPWAFVLVVLAGVGGAYLVFRLAKLAVQATRSRRLAKKIPHMAGSAASLEPAQSDLPASTEG